MASETIHSIVDKLKKDKTPKNTLLKMTAQTTKTWTVFMNDSKGKKLITSIWLWNSQKVHTIFTLQGSTLNPPKEALKKSDIF